MENDVQKLFKVQGAVKQMIANGESPDYIDNFLRIQNETPESIRAMNQFGVENVAAARKANQEFEEKRNSLPERAKRTAKLVAGTAIGGAEGALHGLERFEDAVTLGGYGWLNKKLGGGYEERKKYMQEAADSLGLGRVNKIANLALDIGGVMRSPLFSVLPNPLSAETMLGTAGRGALQGGLASGLQSAFKNDSLENVKRDAAWGAAIGGTVPVAIRGVGRLSSLLTGATTGKGEEAIKGAYSSGKRGSEAFRRGETMTAEDIVKKAQEGRDEIQRAAKKAISEGKQAIGKTPVDKQGLYDSLRDFAQERFMYNGTNLASKGERKVLKEAEGIINRLTKKKNIDVNTLDAVKQQIWKIVPESSNDRAAIALRDALYGKVSEYLNAASPEYASVMKPYALAMDELERIATDTAVKESGTKITSAINKLVKTAKNPETTNIIQRLGGQDLADMLAGYDLRSALPESQVGRMIAAGVTGLGVGTGGSALAWLPLMSPKLMGNVAYRLGQLSNIVPSVSSTANILNYLRLK